LTGCHLGAGVTTLVLQLAREISAIGVKTIAVETNIEHLDQRYRSSIAAPGLVEALSGMAPLESAISVASGELPPRIALGNVADFHRVWKIAALQSLFALLLEKYDLVLVDAPPLLDSAEPELLMGLSAAVILVVIAREFSTVVRRAAQLLQKFSPPVVGTVFSRMIGEPASASDAMFAGLPFKLPLEGLARRLWHDSE
jgi:Mrp family chromosome partitioning ATPase